MALALLPSWLKVPLYRVFFGYRIGRGVRIGLTPFVGVSRCRIGDGVRIGHFNLFYQLDDLEVGERAQVGFFNLFRGGEQVRIGPYASVLRQNVFNAIIEKDFVGPVESTLNLGAGSVVTSGHWLDFSAGIIVGEHSILGGRNSSFWTHSRQIGRPVAIGCHCYLGSEVRIAPGVEIPPFCIVALGSVLSGRFSSPRSLMGGNPASVVRTLRESDLFFITRKARDDIPDDLFTALLPEDLRDLARRHQPIGDKGVGEPGETRNQPGGGRQAVSTT